MFGLGTIINTAGIAAGGLAGLFFGKFLKEKYQESLTAVCGVSVIFIGIAGAMTGMLKISGGKLESSGALVISICLAAGTLIGEIADIEGWFERFGEWLKRKTGSTEDAGFVHGFLTASLTLSIGAMAVVGAVQDGISGDPSVLIAKTVLDVIMVMIMTCSMGKGCIFSAVPVFVFEGGITLLSSPLKPVLTPLAMEYLSMTGSVLIACVGLNLLREKKIRAANMLPSLVLAVAAAFLPA